MVGEKYGDPGDCSVYYECTDSDSAMDPLHCEAGSKYDHKKTKCRVVRPDMKRPVRCTPPCDVLERKKERTQNEGEAAEQPVKSGTKNDTTTKLTDPSDSQHNVPTQPNEPQTTEEDVDGIKAAGEIRRTNDTVESAVVDPNQLGAANDTETTENIPTTTTTTSTPTFTTTTTTTTTTTVPTTTTTTTTVAPGTTTTTESEVVVVVTDGDPGYDIVTSPPGNSSGAVGKNNVPVTIPSRWQFPRSRLIPFNKSDTPIKSQAAGEATSR